MGFPSARFFYRYSGRAGQTRLTPAGTHPLHPLAAKGSSRLPHSPIPLPPNTIISLSLHLLLHLPPSIFLLLHSLQFGATSPSHAFAAFELFPPVLLGSIGALIHSLIRALSTGFLHSRPFYFRFTSDSVRRIYFDTLAACDPSQNFSLSTYLITLPYPGIAITNPYLLASESELDYHRSYFLIITSQLSGPNIKL